MAQVIDKPAVMRTNLILTNKAREGVLAWGKDEHAFFHLQKSFVVHIEHVQNTSQDEMAITLYFNNVENKVLSEKLDEQVAVMNCIVKYDGLLATNFRVLSKRVPVHTNRRFKTKMEFATNARNTVGLPLELHSKIRELPIAEERSKYVQKRISSWEGYLNIQERDATIDDMTASFSHYEFNEDFTRMTVKINGLKESEWKKVKGLSAKIQGSKDELGAVLKAQPSKKTVEIDLRPFIQEQIRKNKWHPKVKELVFSNFATLSQIRRLRKGFSDLEKGLAANANLEKILFEERPRITQPKKRADLQFDNRLNEFQREAVIGAMSAEDLFVIQGPPGTGKTTVISEICQQNAKAGLKTLVASQSNLAVDNALSRLLANKDIRILRYGRTESIEEEGKKFIEDNVALYWREQTLHDLEAELAIHRDRTTELDLAINKKEAEMQGLQEQLKVLEEKITEQELAEKDYVIVEEEIKNLKKSLGISRKELRLIEEQSTALTAKKTTVEQQIKQLEELLSKYGSLEKIEEAEQQKQAEVVKLRQQVSYFIAKGELEKAEVALKNARTSYAEWLENHKKLQVSKEAIEECKKIQDLNVFMEEHHIQANTKIEWQRNSFERIKAQMFGYNEWKDVRNRLNGAIGFLEEKIGMGQSQQILQKVEEQASNGYSSYSIREIDQAIDHFKKFLLDTPDLFVNQLYGYLERLYNRRLFVEEQFGMLENQRLEIMRLFQMMKQEVQAQVSYILNTSKQHESGLLNAGNRWNAEVEQLKQKIDKLHGSIHEEEMTVTLGELQEQMMIDEKELEQLTEQRQTVASTMPKLQQMQSEFELIVQEEAEALEQFAQKEAQVKEINANGLVQEKRLKELEQILQQDLTRQKQYTEETIKVVQKTIEKLHHDKQQLPIKQQLQQQWHQLLLNASEHDLDEIRKLYVNHANVIGTTCVASARKEFMDNYPTFDVVIIDEVSKATPPELLLPMLKGKKIILVGDHHQLPPLIGDDTLEETLKAIIDESDDLQEINELKKLLKESLFERLFKNLPKSNKQMLAIQYRMHENIMKTITPFYENEDDHLRCGLEDSDEVRDHFLEGHYVKRQDHLIWLDMPSRKPYFEEQMKNGKSRFNPGELDTIRQTLLDLDHATAMAITSGKLPESTKKSVGVISFYGEQVKKIDHLVQQELKLNHLQLRTGTVDRFQGMEMDVIIVSMVRNTEHKGGDIGFANDYRRLNVALSRARELLILVGSTEMFTKRAKKKESREMYAHLLEVVKSQNGLRDEEGNPK
ncbi:AAA domain-containing protein [Rummeliibacillus sp. NPDC094406]|uniref:AAA domain-containing protein n=1 Tax=Rummeliibacillus sp. NPDC094406 TaxID=3364511 RepID=UPI003803A949